MKCNFNRRDFLKLSGLLPLSLVTPHLMRNPGISQLPQGQKNILVVVFDAFSAYNISLYGYPRKTAPNIDKLAERATVYHNHFAGGNFTTTGTASLLTGTLPWTHRAFQPNAKVADSVATHNIFNAFQNYYRFAYTQNGWANKLLKQFRCYMEELVPQQKLFLESYDGFIHSLFYNDDDTATVSWTRNIESSEEYSYSLFLSQIHKALQTRRIASIKSQFPRGIPSTYNSDNNGFLLEQAVVGMNIYTKTSAINVMPTLLHLTGQNVPDWAEGLILPPYASTDSDLNRNIYSMTADKNDPNAPFTNASTALLKRRYKLIYCFGYPKINVNEVIQLFDVESDPEELVNLYSSQSLVAQEMLVELKAKLAEVNKPYL